AGVAHRDGLMRLVSTVSGPAVRPARVPDAFAGRTDRLLDANFSFATGRVDFVVGRRRDGLIDPRLLHGFVPRPLAQSLPLYAKLRPTAALAWQSAVADARR